MTCATLCALPALGQAVLPGSNLDPQKAHEQARLVVAAEVRGCEMVIGLGACWCATGLELRPTAVLKGQAGGAALKGLSMQGSGPERFTGPGEEHIFFIGEYGGRPRILKVLPKTCENLAAVRAMGDGPAAGVGGG